MDPITQIANKLLAERARSMPQPEQPAETDPPPYSASAVNHDEDEDDDSDSEGAGPPPLKLTIDATHTIRGNNNLVPTSPTVLSDATKFSTLLLHAINQINSANNVAALSQLKPTRALKVDLTINCGITVIGDRNVVGAVGLRPKSTTLDSRTGPAAVVGAKRKAEDETDEEPPAKRAEIEPMSQ